MTPAEQYRAASEQAAMFDVSDCALIEVTGRDRASFLHSFCTNDIKKLQPGQGCEAFITNVKGRILGHVLIFAEDESLWISSDPGTQTALLEHLKRYIITEDVELHDRTPQTAQLLVSGSISAQRLEKSLTAIGGNDWRMCQQGDILVQVAYRIRRVPIADMPGFLVWIPSDSASPLRDDLALVGCTSADRNILEILRIEAMWPRYGVDITEDHLAQEAGRTAQAISFTKGCYLGQEPIARLDALGHTNRELRGIRFEAPGEVTVGTKVLDAAGSAEVGTISSVAINPVTNLAVALAMLKTAANAPGATVLARSSNGTDILGTVFGPPPIS